LCPLVLGGDPRNDIRKGVVQYFDGLYLWRTIMTLW
jgi:hypothetical protein